MSFGRLVRSVEDPRLPLSSDALAEWFQNSSKQAGVLVSEPTAMGLTAYLRAISLIAGTISMLPIRVYRRGTHDPAQVRTVLDQPSQVQTPFEFWQSLLVQQLGWGNAFALKSRDGASTVRSLKLVHPSRVVVKDDPSGRVFEVLMPGGRVDRLTSWEVAHFPFLSPDGVAGLSPLQACRQALGVSIAAQESAAALFANGSRLSGILRLKGRATDDQAGRLKRRWKERTAGPSSAGDIAVIDEGAEFVPLALPPADAQLLESRQFSVSEVARMFGLPSHLLNDNSKDTSWGSGIEQQTTSLVIFTLMPRIKALEERITRELLPGGWDSDAFDARFDLKGLLRGDSASRVAFYRGLADLHAITDTEVRMLEDMPPQMVGVTPMPSNFALVDAVSGRVRPLSDARSDDEPATIEELLAMLQKGYLAVDKVVSADELRAMLNKVGAGLDVPGPEFGGVGNA